MLWRALCGGVHRAEMLDWDDHSLRRAVHAEIKLAMGVTGEPVFARVVRWPEALLMIAAAVLGGYGGARLAQRLPVVAVRRFVILCGGAMTIYFFLR